MRPELFLQPKEQPEEDMPSVPPATCSQPFDTHEILFFGRSQDLGPASHTILKRARDLSEQNFEAIAELRLSSCEHAVKRAFRNVIFNNVETKPLCPPRQHRWTLPAEIFLRGGSVLRVSAVLMRSLWSRTKQRGDGC